MQDSFSPFFHLQPCLLPIKKIYDVQLFNAIYFFSFFKTWCLQYKNAAALPIELWQSTRSLHFFTSYRVPFPLCNHRGKSFTALWQKQVRYFIFQDATPSFSITEMSFIINSWGRGDNDFPSLHTEALMLQMDLLITASFWLVQQIKTGFKVPLPSTKPKRHVSH